MAARAALNAHREAHEPTWDQADERIRVVWRRTVLNVALALRQAGVDVDSATLERNVNPDE